PPNFTGLISCTCILLRSAPAAAASRRTARFAADLAASAAANSAPVKIRDGPCGRSPETGNVPRSRIEKEPGRIKLDALAPACSATTAPAPTGVGEPPYASLAAAM